MIKMLARKEKASPGELPVPDRLPPLKGFDDLPPSGRQGPRTWLWTLVAALVVVSLVLYVVALGVKGVYDGLQERTLENRQIAQEHYALGVEQMAAQQYDLAAAEFDLALRHDSTLREAEAMLREAKDMAKSQATPTSETRQDAAALLYRQAVDEYEGGNLAGAIAVLDELRALDAQYQAENVATMLTTAHYRAGLNAVAADEMDDARAHFESLLALAPDDEEAQDQLNLVNLYSAALSYWERDWSATIQAFKGLYALAPGYKDVKSRLHNAYINHAHAYVGEANWCRAAEQYASAVAIMPLESTVDARDEARILCQAAAATATAEAQGGIALQPGASPSPAAGTAAVAGDPATATPAPAAVAGSGQIVFASYDAIRGQHDLYIVDLAQRDARLLQANASQPAFDSTGRRLAFHSLDPGQLGLSILDPRTGHRLETTVHSEDSCPTWSPDGGQLVFASNKHGDRRWRVYAISTGEVRGEGEEWILGQMPAWSQDGSRLAYHGCDQRGNRCAVWVMQPGGTNAAPLTSDASDTAPAWSPDGSQVAFVSSRAGNWEIYLVEIATGVERRLTDHAAADVAPTWSPDGRRLAFLSNREGAWAVHLLDVKSGQVQKLIAAGDAYPEPLSERMDWIP
ncbi:MAG: DPP IV N-terminal domain-containing protein [Anaerolineae bacterium]|jgi:TolB protein|nr:DPP IV N-terminal domain-containing protein [Anaerolineae bacterium]